MTSEIIIYQTSDGKFQIETKFEDETIWLTQKQMAELFECSSDNVGLHLKNIFDSQELEENLTAEFFSVVQKEGARNVTRDIKHYNLDAIISVGYRVNSSKATKFRQWATRILKEYLKNGLAINDTNKQIIELRHLLMLYIEKNDKRVNEIIIALNNLIETPKNTKQIGFDTK